MTTSPGGQNVGSELPPLAAQPLRGRLEIGVVGGRRPVYSLGMNARTPYPSDLSDLQWDNIEHLLPGARRPPGTAGRKRTYPRRDLVNAAPSILVRSGSPMHSSVSLRRQSRRMGAAWRSGSFVRPATMRSGSALERRALY